MKEKNLRKLMSGRGNLSVFLAGGREGHRVDIYHSEITFPHGMATAVTKWARSLQGVATAFAAVQGNVLLAPRHPASAQRTR